MKIDEKKIENTPSGGAFVGKKDGQTIIHDEGTMSGYLVGKLHKDGGIKAVNKATGQPLEMQGGEVVITAPAVADQTKREFEGKMMTNREILSAINVKGGGVSFADGGDIPAKIHTTDCEYKLGGKVVKDTDIAHSLGMNSTLKKGKQQFSFGDSTYDVDAIYNAIKKGKLRLKTKEVETFPMKYPVYDKNYAENHKIDYRKPNGITVRTESGEEVLIDGNHRMNNAYLNGRKTMKTYYIEDPKQIAKFTKKNKFMIGGYNARTISSFDNPKEAIEYVDKEIVDKAVGIYTGGKFKEGGHLSKGKSLKQIAEMHNVTLTHINEELAKGLEVEKEHFADFKERTRVAKDHLVENPNYYTILEKAGLKRGGHLQKQELVEKSKKGDTPARDLNNYNDILDLEADGMVGADSGLAFANGGKIDDWFEKPHNLRSVYNKNPFEVTVNDFDCAEKIKNKHKQVEIIKLVNPRVKVPVTYVLVFKNWSSVDELKEILNECSKSIVSYGFTSNEQIEAYKRMSFSDGGIAPIDANIEGDSVDIVNAEFAQGGVVYDSTKPKIEKVTIKDTKYDRTSVVGRNASTVSELQQIVSDYIGNTPKENIDWIAFYVNDATRGTYYIDLNKGKKNTVKNVNPETLNSLNFRRVIDAKDYLVKNYDWTDFFELGSQTPANTSKVNNGKIKSFKIEVSGFDTVEVNNINDLFLALEERKKYDSTILLKYKTPKGGNKVFGLYFRKNPSAYYELKRDDFDIEYLKQKITEKDWFADNISDEFFNSGSQKSTFINKKENSPDLVRLEYNLKGNNISRSFRNGDDLLKEFFKIQEYFVKNPEESVTVKIIPEVVDSTGRITPTERNIIFGKKQFKPSNWTNSDIENLMTKDWFSDKLDFTDFFKSASQKSNQDNEVFTIQVVYTYKGVRETYTAINEKSLLRKLKDLFNDYNLFGAYITPFGNITEVGKTEHIFFVKQATIPNDIEVNNLDAYGIQEFLKKLYPQLDWELFFKIQPSTSTKPFDLSNTKIWIGENNSEMSEKIQKKALELGWEWADGYRGIKNKYENSLYFTENKKILYNSGIKDILDFDNQPEREIVPQDLGIDVFSTASTSAKPYELNEVVIKWNNNKETYYSGTELIEALRNIERENEYQNVVYEVIGFDYNKSGGVPVEVETDDTSFVRKNYSDQDIKSKIDDWLDGFDTDKFFSIDVVDSVVINYGKFNEFNALNVEVLLDEIKRIWKEGGRSKMEITIQPKNSKGSFDKTLYLTLDVVSNGIFTIEPDNVSLSEIKELLSYLYKLNWSKFFNEEPIQTPNLSGASGSFEEITDFKEAVGVLEGIASQASQKYNTKKYDENLQLLKDVKEEYELALSFTPESSFMYERIELLKKITEIQKEITRITELKNGGAFYILSKVIDRLERGENWKELGSGEIMVNEVPQQEIDTVIYTEKFKNWFGDWEKALVTKEYDYVSKVLTESGMPCVMYHGAKRIKYSYRQVSNGVLYLAENRSYAEWFSANESPYQKQGDYLTQCFVNLKNPIDLTPFGVEEVDLRDIIQYIDALYPLAKIYDVLPPNVAMAIMNNQLIGRNFRAWYIIRQFPELNSHIRDNTTYDGFIYYENNPSDMIISESGEMVENVTKATAVFNSNQVKLVDAILFDASLDDWRFEKGGKVN